MKASCCSLVSLAFGVSSARIAARPEHAPGLGQDLLGLRPRDVLDALPAVDHVERRRRVAAEVGHGVVAVGDLPSGDVDGRLGLAVLVELVAVLAREIDDDDLLELVGIAHQHQRAVGDTERDAADVEDAPRPRQAADEDAAPVVQRGTELGHGGGVAPLRRVDQPFHELARALRAVLELGDERVVRGRLAAEEEVEESPVQLAGGEILDEPGVGERVRDRRGLRSAHPLPQTAGPGLGLHAADCNRPCSDQAFPHARASTAAGPPLQGPGAGSRRVSQIVSARRASSLAAQSSASAPLMVPSGSVAAISAWRACARCR